MNQIIKYAVYNTRTEKYWSGASYKCKVNLDMAKLYSRLSDAEYRATVLGPWRQPENNPHTVVKVRIKLEVLDG